MLERNLKQWEEYNARLLEDGPFVQAMPPAKQSDRDFGQKLAETEGAFESTFLMGTAGGIAAEMEGLSAERGGGGMPADSSPEEVYLKVESYEGARDSVGEIPSVLDQAHEEVPLVPALPGGLGGGFTSEIARNRDDEWEGPELEHDVQPLRSARGDYSAPYAEAEGDREWEGEWEGEVSAGEVASVVRRARLAVPGMPGTSFAQLVETHRRTICPEVPLALLIAFSVREGSFDDSTHGSPRSGFTSPPFYELGMFQTPAGLHRCHGPRLRDCDVQPPGEEKPGDPSSWARWCKALGRDPSDWQNPTTQVMVGLHDIENNAQSVRRKQAVADLFPTRGSDWDIRAAVLLSFAGGPGYAVNKLTSMHTRLVSVAESARWATLRAAVVAEGSDRDRSLFSNVDSKMTLAASVDVAQLLTDAPSAPPPAAARPVERTSLPARDLSPDIVRAVLAPWLAQGERDVDRLTDRLFFAYRPERNGKPVAPNEQALATEWLRIREQVRAALPVAPSTAAAPPQASAKSVAGEVRDVLLKAHKRSPRLPAVTLAELVEQHRGEICPEVPLRLLMAFSAVEGSFNDATHGTARDTETAGGKIAPAPYTQPSFYELGVFQTPAGLHGACKTRDFGSCANAPPGIEVSGAPSSWARGCARFHRQPDDWTDPTTQVVVGLHDIEQNAILVRGNPHVSDLFSTPGKDWDLRVAVLMAFAGGPGWAVQWLRARHAQLIALPEEARWGALRDAIASIGRAYDRRLLANVETKVALAARITDAELLGAPAHEIAEERAPLEFDTPHSHAHAAYDRKAAVAYARKFAYRACSDGFMFLDDRNTRGEYVRLPDTATIVKDSDNADHVENADGTPFKLSDGTALTFHVMDDCTHFVSCCIGRPPGGAAGGIQVPVNTWGDPTQGKNPYGISRVSSLLTFVESLERRKVLRTVATKTDDDKKISLLEPGDVIAYFNTDAGEYTHLALYLGDGKIATHTVSRIDEPWALGRDRGFLWTLLHFVG